MNNIRVNEYVKCNRDIKGHIVWVSLMSTDLYLSICLHNNMVLYKTNIYYLLKLTDT